MARVSWINRSNRKNKYHVRDCYRCKLCGRRRSYMRKFGLCRICFRNLASSGEIPGVRKASW